MVGYNIFRSKAPATPRAAPLEAPIQVVVEAGANTIATIGGQTRKSPPEKQPLVPEHVSKLVDEDPTFDKVRHSRDFSRLPKGLSPHWHHDATQRSLCAARRLTGTLVFKKV